MSLGKMSARGAGNGWHGGERYCWSSTTCRTTTHWYDKLQAGSDGVLSHSSTICTSDVGSSPNQYGRWQPERSSNDKPVLVTPMSNRIGRLAVNPNASHSTLSALCLSSLSATTESGDLEQELSARKNPRNVTWSEFRCIHLTSVG